MFHSILERIDPANIRHGGFPRVVVENALPDAYYRELASSFPSLDYITDGKPLANNQPYRKTAAEVADDMTVPAIWQEFLAGHCSHDFYRRLLDIWGPDIDAAHPSMTKNFGKHPSDFSSGIRQSGKAGNEANRTRDIMLDCQLVYNSPVREQSSVRGPHLDSPIKLFAGLFYMRHPDDKSVGGDLTFYKLTRGRYPRPKRERIDPRYVEPIETVPYRANTFVFFINTPFAFHGVSARSVTETPRRYVNFLGECYNGKEKDYFTVRDRWLPRKVRKLHRRWHLRKERNAQALDNTE